MAQNLDQACEELAIDQQSGPAPVSEFDPRQVVGEYFSESFVRNKGVILSFINANCVGGVNTVGGVRLPIEDIRKIPGYLSKHKGMVRAHGVRSLERHFRDNLCQAGAGESLSPEDYGISFSVASLSPRGTQLNPGKRNEGPLFYCLMSGMVEPVLVNHFSDGTADYAHMVNVYLYLLPQAQRRPNVIRRLEEEKTPSSVSQHPGGPSPPGNPIFKKARFAPQGSDRPRYRMASPTRFSPASPPADRMLIFETKLAQLEHRTLPNPPLPSTPAPIWNHNGLSEMPADL